MTVGHAGGAEHLYGEDASGLVSVFVGGLIEHVVPTLAQRVTGQLGCHDVGDLDIVSKNWLFP